MSRRIPAYGLHPELTPIPVRTNLATNPTPSLLTDGVSWGRTLAGATASTKIGLWPGVPTPSYQVLFQATSTGSSVWYQSTGLLLSPTKAYAATLYAQSNRTMLVDVFFSDGVTTVASIIGLRLYEGLWARIGTTLTVSAGANKNLRIAIFDRAGSRWVSTNRITLAQAMIEETGDVTLPWFDGNSTYARWNPDGTSSLYGYA